tara:strand:+ start:229 stop:465 length:237 start_codon:yes stop_codon:yes gene_type:complete
MNNTMITGAPDLPSVMIRKDGDMAMAGQSSLRLGNTTLNEAKLQRIDDALEFIERLAQEDPHAKAIWTAIKTKKRILK